MMANVYRIVHAQPRHLSNLPRIEQAAAALFPRDDLPEPLRSEATPASDFRRAQSAGRLWVALSRSDQPVGFALVRVVDGAAHLHELDVDPEHGRRGIGTGLVRAVCLWARARGYPAVTLTTFSHLSWNAPFYARLGFRILGPDEITPGLARLLRLEASRGLDPSRRVAMRWEESGSEGVPPPRHEARPSSSG